MARDARTHARSVHGRIGGALCACILSIAALAGGGCAGPAIESARANYFLGRYDAALAQLDESEPESNRERVLFLMERGMVRQAAGQYRYSAFDWLAAHELADRLEYFSVSKQSASMLINDSVLAYRGMWYERALLHAFAAKSYFALSLWDDAAVEARNNIVRLEQRGPYPDDPYSRYMNGFCLEMSGDPEGASLQYRLADELMGGNLIAQDTGNVTGSANPKAAASTHELVCFIGIGRPSYAPGSRPDRWRWGKAPYARLYNAAGDYLGRSITLNTTDALAAKVDKVHATRRAVKTATRIAAKEVVSQAVENENELAGELLRVLLFALEQPDRRRWVTLPEWLQVARVPCSADMSEFTIEYIGMDGRRVVRQVVTDPITRRGDTFVSFGRAL